MEVLRVSRWRLDYCDLTVLLASPTLSSAVVTVKQGQAGISYNDGSLVVLKTGRHVMTAATQLFAGFLSLGQQVLNISEVVSMTSDNVGISFDAGAVVLPESCACFFHVFYVRSWRHDAAISIQVVDPCKAGKTQQWREMQLHSPSLYNLTTHHCLA